MTSPPILATRQGISVISVVNMLVVNTTCSNSWGTGPSNGVDIEPDHPSHRPELPLAVESFRRSFFYFISDSPYKIKYAASK